MSRARAVDAEAAWDLLRGLAAGQPTVDARLHIHADGWDGRDEVTAEAADLLDLFLPLLPPRAPDGIVVGQLGQSLDGRIATESGHSHYITGEANRRHLHRLRALCDAVVVGAGTAQADDPRLTVRLCPGRPPTRVVLDSRGTLDGGLRLLTDGVAPTLVLRPAARGGAVAGAEVVALPDGLEPEPVLACLRARGLRRVLVEGGGLTVSRFLERGCLDRLHVGVAPLLIGSGRRGLTLPPIHRLDTARRPPTRVYAMPPDTLFDCDLRGPG